MSNKQIYFDYFHLSTLERYFYRTKDWEKKLYNTLTVEQSNRDYSSEKRFFFGLLLFFAGAVCAVYAFFGLDSAGSYWLPESTVAIILTTLAAAIWVVLLICTPWLAKMKVGKYLLPNYELGEDSFPVEVTFHDGLRRSKATVEEDSIRVHTNEASLQTVMYQKMLLYKPEKNSDIFVFILQKRRGPEQVEVEFFAAEVNVINEFYGTPQSELVLHLQRKDGRLDENHKVTILLPTHHYQEAKKLIAETYVRSKKAA